MDDEPERIDLSSPEDVLIEVIADESPYERWDWKGFKIDSCTVIGGKDGVTGAASYEQSYGGFLDYVLEDIIDCPKREGWFVVEGVTRSEEHTSELQSLIRISYAVFCLK